MLLRVLATGLVMAALYIAYWPLVDAFQPDSRTLNSVFGFIALPLLSSGAGLAGLGLYYLWRSRRVGGVYLLLSGLVSLAIGYPLIRLIVGANQNVTLWRNFVQAVALLCAAGLIALIPTSQKES